MRLNRDALLGRSLNRREVELPEVGGSLFVRELSAAEVGQYVKRHKQNEDELSQMAWIVIRAACDEGGTPLFKEDDVDAVKGMSLNTVKTIAEEAAKLSGLYDEEAAKKNASGD